MEATEGSWEDAEEGLDALSFGRAINLDSENEGELEKNSSRESSPLKLEAELKRALESEEVFSEEGVDR